MGAVSAPAAPPPLLLVSVAGLVPGAPLDAAVALADPLDARRVPLTVLVGPRPHPEVVAWATARRGVGDAVLLHGTRPLPGGAPERGGGPADRRPEHRRPDRRRPERRRPYRRLPAHEAGLRLAAALRTRDALGLPVDGFAAPGWSTSSGVRAALAAAGVRLCLDDTGVHRLGPDGVPVVSRRGPVISVDPWWAARGRRTERDLVHLALDTGVPVARAVRLLDAALVAGAAPTGPHAVLAGPAPRRPRSAGDPEHWSITA
jgi:uncharacterized protein